ncbi:MAG: aspartate/glutamate racemase family protein [Cyanobacteria bacterium P01_E01_bin.42]
MKTIGLIGGMSWESSLEYYRLLNQATREKLGGLRSAKSILYSVDFAEIEQLQHQGNWKQTGEILSFAAIALEKAGADFIILCTNTMHKVAETIEAAIAIPFLHIADATGMEIQKQGLKTVGLLGTKFTMEEDFYKTRLIQKYHLDILLPSPEERETIHRVIYEELCLGILEEGSRSQYMQIIRELRDRGAEGIILGCTEIGLLIQQQHSPIPRFDTTEIHARTAVEYALNQSPVTSIGLKR